MFYLSALFSFLSSWQCVALQCLIFWGLLLRLCVRDIILDGGMRWYFRCCIIGVFLILGGGLLSVKGNNNQALFQHLDNAILQSATYNDIREKRIEVLKRELEVSNDKYKCYLRGFQIYEEYASYQNDSAIAYLQRCMNWARSMDDSDRVTYCQSLMARQLSVAGLYSEALLILDSINIMSVKPYVLGAYYVALNHVYGELGVYSDVSHLKKFYFSKADIYRDSIYKYYPAHSEVVMMKKCMEYLVAGNFKEALNINNQWMAQVGKNNHPFSIAAYYRHDIYAKMGDEKQAQYWLLKSAISDIENGVRDQASLWTLAKMMSHDKNLERPYNYIRFAWNAAQDFGTRVRNWQISPILSMIDSNMQQQTQQSNQQLRLFVVLISILLLLLGMLLVYVNKQRKRLFMAQYSLKESNMRLEELNTELNSINKHLDNNNRHLSELNGALNESNRIKEEYIGIFIGICSTYIDKLDAYRKQVHKMLKNNQGAELLRMTKSVDVKHQEVEEFYNNFDAVFLHIFPDFIEEFNLLLKPEERIVIADFNKLNTILRVFALIRLGIDDSGKIAEFLHCSVNTIYNYRAKMRNAALGNRNDFEKEVKTLGTMID